MRRFMLVVLALGAMFSAIGLISGRSARHEMAVANQASFDDSPVAPNALYRDASRGHHVANTPVASAPIGYHNSSEAPTLTEEQSVPAISATWESQPGQRINHLKRGTLGEEFDGELITGNGTNQRGRTEFSRTDEIAEVTTGLEPPAFDPDTDTTTLQAIPKISDSTALTPRVEAGTDIAQGEGFSKRPQITGDDATNNPLAPPSKRRQATFDGESDEELHTPAGSLPNSRKLIPLPAQSNSPGRRPAGLDDGVPTPRSVPAVERVTLLINKAQTIHIVPAKVLKPNAELIQDETLEITAEAFELVPTKEPGGQHELKCMGNVQLRCRQFRATGGKLSVRGDNLMLEGVSKNKAVIFKEATDTVSDFHLSADKITFTLSLDKIQIGNGVTVSPALPNEPMPQNRLDNIETETSPVPEPRDAASGAAPPLPVPATPKVEQDPHATKADENLDANPGVPPSDTLESTDAIPKKTP